MGEWSALVAARTLHFSRENPYARQPSFEKLLNICVHFLNKSDRPSHASASVLRMTSEQLYLPVQEMFYMRNPLEALLGGTLS
jgi:hypothetical protein